MILRINQCFPSSMHRDSSLRSEWRPRQEGSTACGVFPRPNDTNTAPPPCHFERSGEISLLYGTSRIGAGDLSTQSFNRVQAHLPPLRHAAPLEMTDATGRLASLEKDGNAVTPHCHFDRSEAKWRNLPALRCVVPLWQEISRLRASIELEVFGFISTCSPARNDMKAGSLYSLGGDASTAFRMTGPAGRLRGVWSLMSDRLTVFPASMSFRNENQ